MVTISNYLFLLIFLAVQITLCYNISTDSVYKNSTETDPKTTNKNEILTEGNQTNVLFKIRKQFLKQFNFSDALRNSSENIDFFNKYKSNFKVAQFRTDVSSNIKPSAKMKNSHNNTETADLGNFGTIENSSEDTTKFLPKDDENKVQRKSRKPIKLNMKQGLIMNQILNTYGLTDINNPLCRSHVNEFKAGLRALEPWALKMFDSSSKLMSGVLGGNLAELGAFKQCLNIYEDTTYGPIRGRHCTLHIHPTDHLVNIVLGYKRKVSRKHFHNLKYNILDGVKLTWSVCVPDTCTHDDVLGHFSKSIVDVTEGLNLTLSLPKKHCITLEELPKFTNGDYIFVLCCGLVVAITLISTIVDFFFNDDILLINLFSLKRNAYRLFSIRENNNDISCLHGIRFLSMYLVVYGHRYIHNMATPVVNYMDLVDWLESYGSTTVHGGTTTVDTFLLMSSLLLSYTYFHMTSNGIKINLIVFYINRHLRFLVPLALAVSTHVTVAKHFGEGPLYNDLVAYYQTTCGHFWWSNLLYLQPFVNPRYMCAAQTWYLSVDMFWYYFSPFMLMALVKNQTFGYVVMAIVYFACTVSNFYVAWIYKFNGQMPVTPGLLSSDYFAYHYTQPIIRGGPYILGLAFGHTLFTTKNQKVKMSVCTKTMGWILVLILLPAVILITRSFRLEDFEYSGVFASLFLACHRSIWTFGLMWIIWCCQNGDAGIINSILSWQVFKVLGRLCFNIFLFHYLFQETMQNSKKTPSYFSNFLSIFDSLSDMAAMVILAIPLTLCFEYPFTRMCALIFKPNVTNTTTKVKPHPQVTKE